MSGAAPPVSVLQAAINKAIETAAQAKLDGQESAKVQFIPATRFTGPRNGYHFTTGNEGLGYYYDPLNDVPEDEAEAQLQKAQLQPEDLLKQVRS